MDEFTARNALLSGVQLIRRRPLLVLLWTAVPLVQTLAFAAAARELAVIAREAFFSGRSVVASYNGQLLALSAANLLVSLVVAAVLWTSAFRAILRPAERRPLGFGPEELSMFAVWFITQMVVVIVMAILQVLIVGWFGVPGLGPMTYLIAAVEVLGLFWGAVASVWTFGQGQIAPLRCWTIARGRFWLLAGLVIGVAVLDRVAGVGVRQLATAVGHLFPAPPYSPSEPFGVAGPRVQDVFKVQLLLQDVLLALVGALEIAFIAGIVACAYRTRRQEPQAEAFSPVASGPAT